MPPVLQGQITFYITTESPLLSRTASRSAKGALRCLAALGQEALTGVMYSTHIPVGLQSGGVGAIPIYFKGEGKFDSPA